MTPYYRRGFIAGLKEAYRLLGTEIIYAPGRIFDRIKSLESKFDDSCRHRLQRRSLQNEKQNIKSKN